MSSPRASELSKEREPLSELINARLNFLALDWCQTIESNLKDYRPQSSQSDAATFYSDFLNPIGPAVANLEAGTPSKDQENDSKFYELNVQIISDLKKKLSEFFESCLDTEHPKYSSATINHFKSFIEKTQADLNNFGKVGAALNENISEDKNAKLQTQSSAKPNPSALFSNTAASAASTPTASAAHESTKKTTGRLWPRIDNLECLLS